MTENITIPSPTGALLNAYSADAESPAPKAIIQINHGLAEHAARYGRFQNALAAAGYASVAHDHRGHGHTAAPDTEERVYAYTSGVEKALTDIASVHDHITERWPAVPVVTFGHSAGGLMALNFACRYPKRSAALAGWNSNASGGLAGRAAQAILWIEALLGPQTRPSKVLPKLVFNAWNKQLAPSRTAFDWLSRDPAEVDAYIVDPLCGFPVSISMWRDIFRLIYGAADTAQLAKLPDELPIHILGGAADPATDNAKATRAMATMLESAGCNKVALNILPDTRHESLNETNRDETTAQFINWLDASFPS